jgi:hypothetical protein
MSARTQTGMDGMYGIYNWSKMNGPTYTRVALEFKTCPVASCSLNVRLTGWHGVCRGGGAKLMLQKVVHGWCLFHDVKLQG